MVRRYDLVSVNAYPEAGFETVMEETYGGEFVRHEDYEALADKLEQVEDDLKWFRDRITDIFQAM